MTRTKVKQFPDMEWFARNVIKEGDNRQYGQKRFYDYYKTKYEIALKYRPSRIAEIGVRLGYSAFAFLWACPWFAVYTGFDIIKGSHGGVEGDNFPFVKKMLGRHFESARINLIHGDTQLLKGLGADYDFIHIDGDHSYKGCMHDLEIAKASLRQGGIILIDDYDYVKTVKKATGDFLIKYDDEIKSSEFYKSIRGECVIGL